MALAVQLNSRITEYSPDLRHRTCYLHSPVQPRCQYDDTHPSVLPPNPGRGATPLADHSLDLAHISAEIEGTSWAVVSFCPDDATWCDWLYNNLNGYPVPVPLIEQATPHGLSRPDCVSIFPDRRDPDFASHYTRALETSGYLIVVCSPRSAHSPNVDMQIRAFKRAGGEERVIALVVEGDPDPLLEMRPRNSNLDWLPSWLRFRANAEGFTAAERSEPRIIDARPGVTSMQGVRDFLLSALLEIDRNALGRLGGLQRPLAQKAAARRQSVVAAAPSSIILPSTSASVALPAAPRLNLPPLPPRRSKAPVFAAAAAAILVAAGGAGWFAAQSETKARPSSPALAAAAKPIPRLAIQSATVPVPFAIEIPKPPPAGPAATTGETAPQASGEPHISVRDALPDQAHPVAVTSVVPAMPDDSALLDEAREWQNKAGEALVRRDHDEAIEMYRSAIPAARLYLTRPTASTAGKAEVAEMYRQLGTLQALHASTAEARASYREGRRILLSIRGGRGSWNEECDRLYEAFENSLRSLQRQ